MTQQSEAELTQDQLREMEDAAFNAEMSGEVIDAKAPETPVTNATEEQKHETTSEQNTDIPERVEVIPGWTADELAELKQQSKSIPTMQKAIDSTNGTYGKKLSLIDSAIEQLKSRQPATASLAKLTPQSLKRLSEHYPELAEAFAQDLNEIGTLGGQEVDVAKYEQMIDDRVNKAVADVERKVELKLAAKHLAEKHPDYKDIAMWKQDEVTNVITFKDMKFGNWLSQQSKEIQSIVLNSDDADELSGVLDSYKSTFAKPIKVESKSVLEKSLQPKGINTAPIGKSDKELEDEAFAEEMRS